MSNSFTKRPGFNRTTSDLFLTQFFYTSIGLGSNTVGFLQNTSSSLLLHIKNIQFQSIGLLGGTSLPSVLTYWTVKFNETYTSGGSSKTPINMNRNSSSVASVLAYDNNPTLGGSPSEVERMYIVDERKIGLDTSFILGQDDSISIDLTTDHLAGTGSVSITFEMKDQ